MSKKFLASVIVIIIILGVVAWYFGFLGGERALRRQLNNRPDLIALYNKAVASENAIKNKPDDAAKYFDAGLYWKSIAEQGGPKEFFNKSLAVYEQGIERFGQKNILFYHNGGKLAEHVDDFNKAENYYKKAIDISGADETGYLDLVELYDYKMSRSKDEILAVFKSGEKRMLNPAPLISARASYLRRHNFYAEALVDYKLLSLNFPGNTGYKEIIAELESKIKNGQ